MTNESKLHDINGSNVRHSGGQMSHMSQMYGFHNSGVWMFVNLVYGF